MLRAEYTTQFKKNLKLARLRCHDLGAESKAPAWIVPNVLHRAPHTGGVTPPAKVTNNRARSPSAPHSGGDAARLGKVRLQDELPNCGNRPCKAACRARHAEVTDEGGTAAPHLAPHVDVKTLPRIVISKNLQDYGGTISEPNQGTGLDFP